MASSPLLYYLRLPAANLVDCNVWEYMAFGTLYSSWLTLIHSEYAHPWDVPFFRYDLQCIVKSLLD